MVLGTYYNGGIRWNRVGVLLTDDLFLPRRWRLGFLDPDASERVVYRVGEFWRLRPGFAADTPPRFVSLI